MSVFSELARPSLEALAKALETNRISNGNVLMLQQCIPAEACPRVGSEIDSLINAGMPAPQVAYVIRAVMAERDRAADHALSTELVWTGPEGVTSSSRDTGVVVRELFMSAKKSILLAGFTIHRGRAIFKQLADRMSEEPSLEVRMFLNIPRALRDTTLMEQLVARFAQQFRREHWSGTRFPVIYYDPRALAIDEKERTSLHAKCVVVDHKVSLVTSANFTEAAQVRNIEVGALLHDAHFARALVGQFDELIRLHAVERLPL